MDNKTILREVLLAGVVTLVAISLSGIAMGQGRGQGAIRPVPAENLEVTYDILPVGVVFNRTLAKNAKTFTLSFKIRNQGGIIPHGKIVSVSVYPGATLSAGEEGTHNSFSRTALTSNLRRGDEIPAEVEFSLPPDAPEAPYKLCVWLNDRADAGANSILGADLESQTERRNNCYEFEAE